MHAKMEALKLILQILLVYCSFCPRICAQTSPADGATSEPPMNFMKYVIILGATTGFFLVTTILCTTLLLVMCCLKFRTRTKEEEPKERLFEGSQVSPHWIDTPTQQKSESLGITDLPIWSVKTFTNPTLNLNNDTNSTSSLSNNGTSHENTLNTESSASESTPKSKVTPKRVAPPPPKNKNKKQKSSSEDKKEITREPVEYAVPVTNHGWFGRKKKKSAYKELNLNQIQLPSTYSIPEVSTPQV